MDASKVSANLSELYFFNIIIAIANVYKKNALKFEHF